MIKRVIKDQIRKTGLVKELELKNEKLNKHVINLEKENNDLKRWINDLKVENEMLLSEGSEMVGYTLKTNLRGLSPDVGKPAILKYIIDTIKKDARILDVGFGSGLYGKLLRAFYYQNIDGVDVYDKNIREMGLDKIYDNIFIENILDFDFDHYDLIIMGDVLEHIELESAKELLSSFIDGEKCDHIIVSIPYEYEQGELYDNPYEIHLQPDVTAAYMEEHYPYLKLIDSSTMPNSGGMVATYIWKIE